jgi:hypothetical protein
MKEENKGKLPPKPTSQVEKEAESGIIKSKNSLKKMA